MMMLGGRASIEVREESLALSDLAAVLALAAPDLPEAPRALVIDTTSGRLALACDRVIGEQEIVVKPLGPMLAGVSGYLGAAVLGDGAVMLILDPAHLVRRAPRAAAAVRIDDAALKAMAAPKVLVVDDQFTVRELQRSILSASGYRVEVACDGQEALDTLNGEDAFDIVVTDLQMPEMDGLALLAAIRADPITPRCRSSWSPRVAARRTAGGEPKPARTLTSSRMSSTSRRCCRRSSVSWAHDEHRSSG